jgi:hypothetical protein
VVRHDAEPEGSQHRPYEEEGLSHGRLPVVVTHPVQLWTAEHVPWTASLEVFSTVFIKTRAMGPVLSQANTVRKSKSFPLRPY